MKVLTVTQPGSFQYSDQAKPELTKGHALLRITRIGVCGSDLHAFEGTQPYFSYPRILGHELSAELVDADGADDFKPGEKITIIPYFNCGQCIACRNGTPNCCATLKTYGVHIDGGMREFVSVPSYSLVHNNGLSEDALALIEPLSIGAHGIRRAGVRKGEFILIVGAGPIGLGTMEFGRIAGAEVIALDVNQQRLDFCKQKIGVTHTINATTEDVTKRLMEITNGDMPTVIIDCTGSLKAINNSFQYMSPGGRYILIGLQKGEISVSHPEFHRREATLMSSRNATRQDFDHVISALTSGKVDPVTYITHRVGFDDVKDNFESWLDPKTGVIKAMISL